MTWIFWDVIFSFHLFHLFFLLISPSMWFGHSVGTQSASNRRSLGRSMARGRTRWEKCHAFFLTGKCYRQKKLQSPTPAKSSKLLEDSYFEALLQTCSVSGGVQCFHRVLRRRLESREVLDLQTRNRSESKRDEPRILPASTSCTSSGQRPGACPTGLWRHSLGGRE